MELRSKKNENCELYKGLNVKLYKRCDYCSDRYVECLGTQYNIVVMITFTLLLILPYLMNYPLVLKLAILTIITMLVILGFFVNSKTDKLYLSEFHLKKKSSEMENLNTELTKLNASMAARTEELTRANQELKKLDQMKSDFISMISHEFRSPLTSIKAFSQILLKSGEQVAPGEQADFLRIIDQESDRLTRLINDILDLSKLEAGKMEWNMEQVLLHKVITKATQSLYPLSKAKEIEIDVELDESAPTVLGDPDRLIQVMTNLLGNAIKFTPEQGKIRITAKTVGDNIQVLVEDSGTGIPEEEFENIFNKFKQGGNTLTDRPQGTGLGLPICREIVQAHLGKLWVESTVGEGSRFYFNLPFSSTGSFPEENPSLAKTSA